MSRAPYWWDDLSVTCGDSEVTTGELLPRGRWIAFVAVGYDRHEIPSALCDHLARE